MLNIDAHISEVLACKKCPGMIGPAVTHHPLLAKIYLIGQAPGPREGQFGRPFAWTAGRTMFRWFQESLGMDEATFRARIYMAAVARCFTGKAPGGGDRKPSPDEIANCEQWLMRESAILE